MATLQTTITGAKQIYAAIVDFLTDAPATAGRDWTKITDMRENGYGQVVLKNAGLSGSESVAIGFDLRSAGDGVHYALAYRVYRQYQAGDDFYGSVFGSRVANGSTICAGCMPLSAAATKIFMTANKSRVVLVTLTGLTYSSQYLGLFERFALPTEYPYPLVCLCDGYLEPSGTAWASSSAANYDSTSGRAGMLQPKAHEDGRWSNCVCVPGNTWAQARIVPTENYATSVAYTGAQVRYYSGAPAVLMPLYVAAMLLDDSGKPGPTLGQLDGVMWASNIQNVAESTVTIGDDTYHIFPQLQTADGRLFFAVLED